MSVLLDENIVQTDDVTTSVSATYTESITLATEENDNAKQQENENENEGEKDLFSVRKRKKKKCLVIPDPLPIVNGKPFENERPIENEKQNEDKEEKERKEGESEGSFVDDIVNNMIVENRREEQEAKEEKGNTMQSLFSQLGVVTALFKSGKISDIGDLILKQVQGHYLPTPAQNRHMKVTFNLFFKFFLLFIASSFFMGDFVSCNTVFFATTMLLGYTYKGFYGVRRFSVQCLKKPFAYCMEHKIFSIRQGFDELVRAFKQTYDSNQLDAHMVEEEESEDEDQNESENENENQNQNQNENEKKNQNTNMRQVKSRKKARKELKAKKQEKQMKEEEKQKEKEKEKKSGLARWTKFCTHESLLDEEEEDVEATETLGWDNAPVLVRWLFVWMYALINFTICISTEHVSFVLWCFMQFLPILLCDRVPFLKKHGLWVVHTAFLLFFASSYLLPLYIIGPFFRTLLIYAGIALFVHQKEGRENKQDIQTNKDENEENKENKPFEVPRIHQVCLTLKGRNVVDIEKVIVPHVHELTELWLFLVLFACGGFSLVYTACSGILTNAICMWPGVSLLFILVEQELVITTRRHLLNGVLLHQAVWHVFYFFSSIRTFQTPAWCQLFFYCLSWFLLPLLIAGYLPAQAAGAKMFDLGKTAKIISSPSSTS